MTDSLHDPRALRRALCEYIDGNVSLDPGVAVAPDTDLLLTGLVDSLGVVQLVAWMEDEFGFTIEPTEVVLENFQTVEAMASFVERRRPDGLAQSA